MQLALYDAVRRKTTLLLIGASLALATWLTGWFGGQPLEAPPVLDVTSFEVAQVREEERVELSTLIPERSASEPEGGSTDAEPMDLPSDSESASESPPARAILTQHARTPRLTGTTNYLLVGTDRTRGRAWGRADALVLAVFDDESRHVGAVSIPRDLYVEVPGHGPARINATLRIASVTDQEPLALMSQVASTVLGLPIHHVVVADLSVFERTIDELGGITVEVACPIEDNFIDERSESGRRLLSLEAGRHRMDGVTAAMYIRSRHGRSDWSRARRQQAVLAGLRNRIAELSVTDWLPALDRALEEGVFTTMSRWELLELARRLTYVDLSRLHGLVLGYRTVEHVRTPEGRAVLVPRPEEIDAALSQLFASPSPGTRIARRACADADVALR